MGGVSLNFPHYVFEDLSVFYLDPTENFYGQSHTDAHFPMHETTRLMQHSLQLILHFTESKGLSVLDMGCGNAVLAVQAAREKEKVGFITACDIETQSVIDARATVDMNAVDDRVAVVQSDLFSALQGKRFNIVLFNLPGGSEREEVAKGFLQNLRDHLASGGFAVVTWPIHFTMAPGEVLDAKPLYSMAAEYAWDIKPLLTDEHYGTFVIGDKCPELFPGMYSTMRNRLFRD